MRESSDLKIGTKVTIKINGKVKRATISDIIIESYISGYKVVVKYVDEELNIQYTDFINKFLDNLVYEQESER